LGFCNEAISQNQTLAQPLPHLPLPTLANHCGAFIVAIHDVFMTPAQLYYMAMESNTAGDLMRELCAALGTPYPPSADDHTEIQREEETA